MADFNEQQANGKACATDPKKSEGQSSTSQENGFDSCGCGPVNREPRAAFHPWDPDTWECETTGTSETSSSLNAEDLQTGETALESARAEEPAAQPFAARANAAENRELWQDLVDSQEPRDPSETQAEPMPSLPETAAKPAMQWTLVDHGTASCDKPGCDPATCDSDDCEDTAEGDGRDSTSYQEQPEYATASTSAEPVVSYRFDLDAEPGPAPEPMSARNETAAEEPVTAAAAEPKKRGAKRGAKKAAETAVFPEQTTPAAEPAAKPKRAAAKKGGKKPAAKKAAKGTKGKKPAKKTTAKKGAKKPAKKAAAPRGKKGAVLTPPVDPMLPSEKAA